MNYTLEQFSLTHRTIFGLLAQNLFGVPFSPEKGVDWAEVLQESRNQAVGFHVFTNSHQILGIEEGLRDIIQAFLFNSALHNAKIHKQHGCLHMLLSEKEIPYVVLKGVASASYYPDPQNRMMGDVDFYVDKAYFEKALAVFQENGFTPSHLDHISHVVLQKGHIHLEMHHTPAGVPNGPVEETVRSYLRDLTDQRCLVNTETVTCACPSDFHHGLTMLMHLQHHLLSEGIGLRHLCDWAVFVRHFQADAFQELFHNKLKAIGLWQFARLLSLCAVQYLGLPEQSWMQEKAEDTETAFSLMQDILSGGNFGRKDRQRAYEGLFISNRGKDGVQNNRIAKGFQALTRITYIKYPFIKKCPILLPFGWVCAFIGFLLRTHRRNQDGQNIHSLSAYQKSAPRIRLYQQLKLYEPEN